MHNYRFFLNEITTKQSLSYFYGVIPTTLHIGYSEAETNSARSACGSGLNALQQMTRFIPLIPVAQEKRKRENPPPWAATLSGRKTQVAAGTPREMDSPSSAEVTTARQQSEAERAHRPDGVKLFFFFYFFLKPSLLTHLAFCPLRRCSVATKE